MKYVILVAGKGSRLHPLTIKYPKTLYKLDKDTTVIKRMINLIRENDIASEIIVVTGFEAKQICNDINDVKIIYNPFYEITNSIVSLWFTKEEIKNNEVTIINGDIVMDTGCVANVITKSVNEPYALLDSSIKMDGDYNAQVNNGKIIVMGKNLEKYYGEYAGITKLPTEATNRLIEMCEIMINDGLYDQWYENALVQLIFQEDFKLKYIDISNYQWTEIDNVDDLILAKEIHNKDKEI